MILIFRYTMIFGTGTILALSNGFLNKAQALPNSQENRSSDNVQRTSFHTNQRAIANAPAKLSAKRLGYAETAPQITKTNKLIQQSSSTYISQANPQSTDNNNEDDNGDSFAAPKAEPTPDIEPLNPSANPLLFPTKPEEVQIDEDKGITLKQAVELALRNNKDLEEAKLNLERARQELNVAKAVLYPNLDANANITNSESAGGALGTQQFIERQVNAIAEGLRQQGRPVDEDAIRRDVEQQQRQRQEAQSGDPNSTNVSGSLRLSYNIYTGRGKADIQRAERELRSSELDVERLVEETRFQAARSYYNLQNEDASVEIEKGAVRDAKQTLRDAQLLEQAGLGTKFDTLRAEVELARAQQRLTQAQANQKTARRQLVNTLNLGQKVNLVTADEIKEAGTWDLPLEDTIVLAYKNRAELEQFLVQGEVSDQQREIELSAVKPQVQVFAQYELAQQLDDGLEVDIQDGYSLGAEMQWRLFDGGAARAGARQREIERQIAENSFSRQRNDIRVAVEEAFYNLEANRDNIVTARKSVNLGEESLKLARLRFQAGVGTQTDVIDAQRELTNARGDFFQAVIQYNQSLNQLRRAVSNLPDNNLSDLP